MSCHVTRYGLIADIRFSEPTNPFAQNLHFLRVLSRPDRSRGSSERAAREHEGAVREQKGAVGEQMDEMSD